MDIIKVNEFFKNVDFATIFADFIINTIGEKAVSKIENNLLKAKEVFLINKAEEINPVEIIISQENVIKNIVFNINKSYNWSKEINLKILPEAKELKEIFIQLDLYITQIREKIEPLDFLPVLSSLDLGNKLDKNILLFGGPGAGKTTLMMNLYQILLTRKNKNSYFSCPIVIRFREISYPSIGINPTFGLFDIILEIFGINIGNLNKLINNDYFFNKKKEIKDSKVYLEKEKEALINDINHYETQIRTEVINYRSQIEMILQEFIDECRIVFILDGYDEIPSIEVKNQVERDLYNLTLSLKYSRFIITSRNAEFNSILHNTRTFEICPLSEQQINDFARRWLKNDKLAIDLVTKVRSSPFYDTAIRPLTLAYLCSIYEIRLDIPSKPRYVYEYVVNLLIDKWDTTRKINRANNFPQLYLENMKKLLSQIAFELTFGLQKIIFDNNDLSVIYNKIYYSYNLEKDKSQSVIDEIESHNGLLLKLGSNSYQFAHKSLQEYLTALYINGLAKYPTKNVFVKLPNEMAITVCLSSNINNYLANLTEYIRQIPLEVWLVFISRLVIEKPDFNNEEGALIFLLSLYSFARDSSRLGDIIFNNLSQYIGDVFSDSNINIGYRMFCKYYRQIFNDDEVIFVKENRFFYDLETYEYAEDKLIVPRVLFLKLGI